MPPALRLKRSPHTTQSSRRLCPPRSLLTPEAIALAGTQQESRDDIFDLNNSEPHCWPPRRRRATMRTGLLMINPIPTLLTIAVCWLPSGAVHPAVQQTLDLRLPELQNIQAPDPQKVTTRADSNVAHLVATAIAPAEWSHAHLSLAGVGAIFWAAHHPAEGWRVLLPIQPGDGFDAIADVAATCSVFAGWPTDRASC
jgi:hypothetical protein